MSDQEEQSAQIESQVAAEPQTNEVEVLPTLTPTNSVNVEQSETKEVTDEKKSVKETVAKTEPALEPISEEPDCTVSISETDKHKKKLSIRTLKTKKTKEDKRSMKIDLNENDEIKSISKMETLSLKSGVATFKTEDLIQYETKKKGFLEDVMRNSSFFKKVDKLGSKIISFSCIELELFRKVLRKLTKVDKKVRKDVELKVDYDGKLYKKELSDLSSSRIDAHLKRRIIAHYDLVTSIQRNKFVDIEKLLTLPKYFDVEYVATEWLSHVGLEQYETTFRQYNIDVPVILFTKKEKLAKILETNNEHHISALKKSALLVSEYKFDPQFLNSEYFVDYTPEKDLNFRTASNEMIKSMLKEYPMLESKIELFSRTGVNGAVFKFDQNADIDTIMKMMSCPKSNDIIKGNIENFVFKFLDLPTKVRPNIFSY